MNNPNNVKVGQVCLRESSASPYWQEHIKITKILKDRAKGILIWSSYNYDKIPRECFNLLIQLKPLHYYTINEQFNAFLLAP